MFVLFTLHVPYLVRENTSLNNKICFLALAKNSSNVRGTGGGKGTQLTPAEVNALDSYNERDSDVIAGVDGGYETQILVVCFTFKLFL